jgi:hypothetical protein
MVRNKHRHRRPGNARNCYSLERISFSKSLAKANPLESILEALCRVVEQTASGCLCSVILIDPGGSKIEQAVAPSLPSSYNDRFPGTPVDREGGPCTEAARRKTQVIASDVASDSQWNTYGWRTAALTHGLKACWSTTCLRVALYWVPRVGTPGE